MKHALAALLCAAATLAQAQTSAPTTIPVHPEMRHMDGLCSLRYDIDWATQDLDAQGQPRVIDLLAPGHRTPADALYMFVYREDGKLLIRPSDRGNLGSSVGGVRVGGVRVRGDGAQLPLQPSNALEGKGACDERDGRPDQPLMYVRHAQLGNGLNAYAAGMLQVQAGRVIWISNESGHYRPLPSALTKAAADLAAHGDADLRTITLCAKLFPPPNDPKTDVDNCPPNSRVWKAGE